MSNAASPLSPRLARLLLNYAGLVLLAHLLALLLYAVYGAVWILLGDDGGPGPFLAWLSAALIVAATAANWIALRFVAAYADMTARRIKTVASTFALLAATYVGFGLFSSNPAMVWFAWFTALCCAPLPPIFLREGTLEAVRALPDDSDEWDRNFD